MYYIGFKNKGNLPIQSEYREIRTRNNSVFGHFSHSAGFRICCTRFFYISNTFINNTRLKLAKIKQGLSVAELLLFENYLLSSSTLSSKNNRAYSKKCAKKQVRLFVYFDEIIWLIIMKVKRKNHINTT